MKTLKFMIVHRNIKFNLKAQSIIALCKNPYILNINAVVNRKLSFMNINYFWVSFVTLVYLVLVLGDVINKILYTCENIIDL